MFEFQYLFSLVILTKSFGSGLAVIANENNKSVNEFRYCLIKAAHPGFKECVGRTAISFLQRFDEKDNFSIADNIIASRDDAAASRSLVNFFDTDPVDFRGILENAGAVISQRSLEFHMDTIYPGLMFKIGPSADSNSVAEFVLDRVAAERQLNYEEPSTARILTKQYFLPFLLGLKFNLVALVPILFAVICLLLKKSLFIAKFVIYISSILGVGGIAGALGTLIGWKDSLLGGHGFGPGIGSGFGLGIGNGYRPGIGVGGLPVPPNAGAQIGGNVGVYAGKNTVYSQYDQDELQYTSPYKRKDRKVTFENTRENSGHFSASDNKNNLHSTIDPGLTSNARDHFYNYEQQILLQEQSGKLRSSAGNLNDHNDEEGVAALSDSPNHHFKTSDNSGWKVINLSV